MALCIRCNIYSPRDCNLTSQIKNKFCTSPELTDEWASENVFQIMFCNITALGTELFKNYSFTSISITENEISVVPSYTFTNLNVASLILKNNGIEVLEINAFHELTVSDIDLSGNEIHTLNSSSFFNVYFIYFRINNNPITIIRKNDFGFLNFRNIKLITMEDTHLKYFDTDCFINKSVDNFIFLHYNTSLIKDVCKQNYRINNILEMCDNNSIIKYGICFLLIIGYVIYLLYIKISQSHQ